MQEDLREARAGEELPLEQLNTYLTRRFEGFDPIIEVKQFGAGHSNLTYLLKSSGEQYVLRRPPHGVKIKGGHDMSREYTVLRALHARWPKAPRPYMLCEDESVLGAPFYMMERAEGVILRGAAPAEVALPEEIMRQVCEALVETLAEIHGLDVEVLGLSEFGRPQGYVRRQIEGWTRRYALARTDTIPSMERAAEWLAGKLEAIEEQPATLIHNDFKYDNLILDPQNLSQVRAVLDWEMATVGDPLMDLGTMLAYWVEPTDSPVLRQLGFGPTALPGNMTRDEIVRRYGELTGRDIEDALFYYVYGLFKVAVVGQQIYARYKSGLTQDERFKGLIFAVKALGDRAVEAVEQDRL